MVGADPAVVRAVYYKARWGGRSRKVGGARLSGQRRAAREVGAAKEEADHALCTAAPADGIAVEWIGSPEGRARPRHKMLTIDE